MATSKSAKHRDIGTIDTTQFINDMFVQTSDVLRILRLQCRTVCDMQPFEDGAPITEAEAQLIFTFCYVCHNGPSTDWQPRSKRSLEDLYEYVRGHNDDKLPYYVMRSFDVGIRREQLPDKLITCYRETVALMQQAIPEYSPDTKHLLPYQHG